MSEPTRYRVANNQAQLTLGGNILAVDPFGPLVDYIDYARLKAEVERLRKAGDGMEEVIWLNGCVSGMEIKERAVKAWKKAKEGKPSV